MNVASLGLCRELYELSGWRDTDFGWLVHSDWETGEWSYELSKKEKKRWVAGAYDAGYLLRKLQAIDDPDNGIKENIYVNMTVSKGYSNAYAERGITDVSATQPIQRRLSSCDADTPEDALCILAIELFKSGVLKKGEL